MISGVIYAISEPDVEITATDGTLDQRRSLDGSGRDKGHELDRGSVRGMTLIHNTRSATSVTTDGIIKNSESADTASVNQPFAIL